MTGSVQRTAAQWALLFLLVLGVVGMHHVNVDMTMPDGNTATAGPHGDPDEPEPASDHGMAHMCLAILSALVSLALLGWSLLRLSRASDDLEASTPAWPRAPARSPPRGGRGVLNSLCVLRL